MARALFHEFATDPVATGVDEQFLWGKGFMISPVLREGHRSVTAYFPDARWYDYYNGTEVKTCLTYFFLTTECFKA